MKDSSKLDNFIKDKFDWLRAYELHRVEGTKFIREWIVPKKNNDDQEQMKAEENHETYN